MSEAEAPAFRYTAALANQIEKRWQDIAGADLMPFAIGGFERATAPRDEMKSADMAQMRHCLGAVPALRTDNAERCGETTVKKDGAGQPHGPQDFRQNVIGGVRRLGNV